MLWIYVWMDRIHCLVGFCKRWLNQVRWLLLCSVVGAYPDPDYRNYCRFDLSVPRTHCQTHCQARNVKKVKVCHLYIASSELLHFWSAQHGSHSFLHCKYTMPPLPCSSPGGSTTEWTVIGPADETYYSFIDPVRMKGWVGLVGWPTADGLPI